MLKAKAKDLNLGDIVKVFDGEYGTATVYQIDPEGNASVWRPYVHTGDVQYSGNRIIPYIGLEDFRLYAHTEVEILRKGEEVK